MKLLFFFFYTKNDNIESYELCPPISTFGTSTLELSATSQISSCRISKHSLIEKARKIGLEKINPSKCEIFFCNGRVDEEVVSNFQDIAPGIRVINANDLELLGSPILEEEFEKFIVKELEKITLLISRLNDLQSHYALFLLKTCFTVPKLIYFLKTTPAWRIENIIDSVDIELKNALITILNIQLDETHWTQATLPVLVDSV